ncbi:hypothetical protein EW146_g8170 [Bondarzewia mesenterica]|uniref:ubiquitinyl hydrolase 1 n=1 Tax=Bondarzewia mesenterica TaxID=1095465 RepID=A0A4S4LGT7_9AGAM|nr:hypothetical protein EW146_g8170 [Bondarzewia mesenterica]
MTIPESLRTIFLAIFSNSVLQQSAPLLVLILIPLFVLFIRGHLYSLVTAAAAMFTSLSSALPWNWGDSHFASTDKHRKKKHVRTRAQQIAVNGDAKYGHEKKSDENQDGTYKYYPGLVNISGTYCFMNSTMQALASLSYLQPNIDAIHDKAEALDVPTPVVDAFQDLLHSLNTPASYPSSIRPIRMIDALSNFEPGKKSPLFSSRQHQDAQELFQLVSECIKKEAQVVDKEGQRDRGLGGLSELSPITNREVSKGVFDGLTANRRSCVECGYTEAVMHFAFDSWQLNVPRMAASCSIDDCLADYTRLELLTDCICRKCSMLATLHRTEQEAERLTEMANANEHPSSSKKKRAREARKFEAKVKLALEEGRIEEDIKGVKMEKVFSKASTKQAMIARPPPVLALHLNRSMHHGTYATKNSCRIVFPEILDLTPYTTSGKLSTSPSVPISSPPPPVNRSTTPTPSTVSTPRVLYRLSALVCHYGQHSFGHYVCYRRKPRPAFAGSQCFTPPKMPHFLECDCETCQYYGPVRDGDERTLIHPQPGRGWLRISDDSVQECGIESVLQEGSGAFMLYYERIVQPRPNIYPLGSPKGSEETVKPRANGSSTLGLTMVSQNTSIVGEEIKMPKPERAFGARVIRSVETGRSRSAFSSAKSVSSSHEASESVDGDLTQETSQPADALAESLPPMSVIEIVPSRSSSLLETSTRPASSCPSPSRDQSHALSPSRYAGTPQHHLQPPQSIDTSSQISPVLTVGLRA